MVGYPLCSPLMVGYSLCSPLRVGIPLPRVYLRVGILLLGCTSGWSMCTVLYLRVGYVHRVIPQGWVSLRCIPQGWVSLPLCTSGWESYPVVYLGMGELSRCVPQEGYPRCVLRGWVSPLLHTIHTLLVPLHTRVPSRLFRHKVVNS